jgi:hypothetical protein
MLTMAFNIKPVKAVIPGIELKYQTPDLLPKGLIYVLVETSLFSGIEASLSQYTKDLESIDGFSVGIYTVSTSNATAIRSFLLEALPEGLVGCLLVGDISKAHYEWIDPEFGTYYNIPTDFYYMDLDGVWNDTNGNGAYDKHSGEASAEIWVGSLQPSMVYGDDIWLLNNYFKKNHLYRTGKLALPKRALVYLDVYDEPPWPELFFNSIKVAYEDTVVVADDEATVASDYLERLLEGYEWIYLGTHGSPSSHTFELHGGWDGTVYGSQYRSIDPHTFFYILNACFTTAGYNNVAGSAVFANTYGLLAIGDRASADTTLQTHQYRIEFWEALSKGKCIGEAYLEDVKIYEDMLIVDPEYKIPGEEYGWQIIADPSLHIHGYPDIAPPVVTIVSPQNVTYTMTSIALAFTVDEAASWIGYSLDNQANVTITGNTTLTDLSEGTHYITVYANDSSGNMGASEMVYFTIAIPPPPLSTSISPPSASILVGQSVTFTSTVSGGYPPYSYQWYLNGAPVSGANATSWTFTPTTSGICFIHLKVTDAKANTAQSDTARITVATVPVGGYSIPIKAQNTPNPLTLYLALIAILATVFTAIRRKIPNKKMTEKKS